MIDIKALQKSVRGKKVLIDTNIIIYLTEEAQPYFDLSRELFSLVEAGSLEAVFSILSIAEVMQGPLKAGKTATAMAVKNYLLNFPNSYCQQITSEILERVGTDKRVKWKTLRTVDSLIIASGLHAKADLFVSNDLHFIRSLPANMLLSFSQQRSK